MSSTTRPDDLDELLGAYALDAVDDDERRQIDELLATDPRARAEVREHREVATMLAYSGSAAPEGLWDRISRTLDDRAPAPGPELAKVLPLAPRTSRKPSPWARIGTAVAGGVAAAAIVTLGFVVADQRRELDQLRPQAVDTALNVGFSQALADPASAQAELLSDDGRTRALAVLEPNGVGYLSGSGLPQLPDGETYQLWGVIEGKVISLGTLGQRPNVLAFSVHGNVTALVITEEQGSGVPVSSQPAALKGELT